MAEDKIKNRDEEVNQDADETSDIVTVKLHDGSVFIGTPIRDEDSNMIGLEYPFTIIPTEKGLAMVRSLFEEIAIFFADIVYIGTPNEKVKQMYQEAAQRARAEEAGIKLGITDDDIAKTIKLTNPGNKGNA